MATIINNSLTADESALRVHNPIFYVPDPDKGKPLAAFKAYFGEVGRDPTNEDNQKFVYALQEDGSAVPMDQPVIGSAGGVPEYNGSFRFLPVRGSVHCLVPFASCAKFLTAIGAIFGHNSQCMSPCVVRMVAST